MGSGLLHGVALATLGALATVVAGVAALAGVSALGRGVGAWLRLRGRLRVRRELHRVFDPREIDALDEALDRLFAEQGARGGAS